MKKLLQIFLFGMLCGLIFSAPNLIKKYKHYQDVERFDQIEKILMKGSKVVKL